MYPCYTRSLVEAADIRLVGGARVGAAAQVMRPGSGGPYATTNGTCWMQTWLVDSSTWAMPS